MRFSNDGKDEINILQNQFTGYLITSIKWDKAHYLKKRERVNRVELSTDMEQTHIHSDVSSEQRLLEGMALAQAIRRISDRDRYIFLARALDDRSFYELAAELGLTYKGVSAAYYRVIEKLRQELWRMNR